AKRWRRSRMPKRRSPASSGPGGLPRYRRGLSAAAIMGFTRAASEFGATVTVAGNIPFQTQTLASAIYAAQQVGKDTDAAILIGVALALGFAALATAEWLISRSQNRRSS
ncbi:MAG: hypothetical protein AAF552_13660, partial [Pseudomonadota bacterium]